MGMIIDMTLTEFIVYSQKVSEFAHYIPANNYNYNYSYHYNYNSQKVSEFAPLHSRLHTVFDGGRLGETEEARLLVVMIKYTFSK